MGVCRRRNLKVDEIECKVSTVSEKGISLLLYKTARTDMQLLNEEYGVMNWQCEYKEVKGNMYCGISVWDKEKSQWVTKWDCGVESAYGDKEKGEASDAYKRAGFKWGIGIELYTAPFIWIDASKVKLEKRLVQGRETFSTKEKFSVSVIEYNEKREITNLVIVNGNGVVVYEQTKSFLKGSDNTKQNKSTGTSTKTDKLITDAQRKRLFAISNGNNDLVKQTIEKYGYTKTEEIKMSDYEKICDEIQKVN